MISRLAKETVERFKDEGLNPTFEDVIRLNTLGLKVETGSSAYEFGSVPRMGFLGDYVFHEPTIAKRMWLEEASNLLKDDFLNQICLTAFALHTPFGELPTLSNIGVLTKAVERFRDEVLLGFTDTQILNCLTYVMKGTAEDFEDGGEGKVDDLPEEMTSVARQALIEALSYGLDEDVKYDLTLPQLEKVVALAALHSGVDVLKGEHAQAVGRFYQECGRIHARLISEHKGDGTEHG